VEGYLHASGSERQAPEWTARDTKETARDTKGAPRSVGTPRSVHSSPPATPRAVLLPLYASSTGGHTAQEGRGTSGGSSGWVGGQRDAVEEEDEELAPGWKRYVSRSSRRPFYKNKATGATQWARPTPPAF
jgi:hypothetical protein